MMIKCKQNIGILETLMKIIIMGMKDTKRQFSHKKRYLPNLTSKKELGREMS